MSRTAVVLGASADIGAGISRRLVADGWQVIGTHRSPETAVAIADADLRLIRCDVSSSADVSALAAAVAAHGASWDLFVSAVGRLDPVGRWDELDFGEWERSVRDNSTAQLGALHALLPLRSESEAHAMFFAGGGTNGPFRNYSAYCVAKIALIKMCELLHDEIADLNAFIIGPGFLPTKIHAPTLADPEAAGENYAKTLAFYDRPEEALSVDDVYRCLRWCMDQGREVVGGRNVAAAHDPWDSAGDSLVRALEGDADAWRLRRSPAPTASGTPA